MLALHYTTLHYATLLSGTPLYTTVHYTNYNDNYNYTRLHHSTPHYTTLHYTLLISPPKIQLQIHHTDCTTPQLHRNYNATTLRYNYNYNYNYTTQHPAVVGEVTTATLSTPPKKHKPQLLSDPSVDSSQQPISPIGFLF